MKLNLRKRYVFWLLLTIVTLVVLQLIAFAVYEISEINSWKNPEEVEEEVGEIMVLLGVDALILPLVMLISWIISGRMLQPLHAVASTARRVSAGQLQERVTTPFPDDEMAALVQTVNQAFDKYHAVLRRLEQFTSDASHQLRTPLAAMRMLGEVSLLRLGQVAAPVRTHQEPVGTRPRRGASGVVGQHRHRPQTDFKPDRGRQHHRHQHRGPFPRTRPDPVFPPWRGTAGLHL